MARRSKTPPSELVRDPGVLEATSTLEVFGSSAVTAVGGIAVLPHRGAWFRARKADLDATGWFDDSTRGPFNQAVVHLQKGRDATWQGLFEAWQRLAHAGPLLLVGGNDLGIKTAVKRLNGELDQAAEIVANRAHARVACWRRDAGAGPLEPVALPVAVATAGGIFQLRSSPGVFSADAVDLGTEILLEHLDQLDAPKRIFDPGCGLGVLGLAALRRWPSAAAVLADVDHRAVECARQNALDLGLSDRCQVEWWDAVSEAPPMDHCDVVLLNPPFHSGVPVDLQPARAMFRAIDAVLAPGGRALVVANRTLPWERDLREIGALRQLADRRGYKLIEVSR